MGRFVINMCKNEEYQFSLKAANGQIILNSKVYKTIINCEKAIDLARKNSQDESKFEKKINENGDFYFDLKDHNGKVIGTSKIYETENGRDKGMLSVAKNAGISDIINTTMILTSKTKKYL